MAYQSWDLIGASERMSPRSGTNGIVIHTPQTGGLEGVKEWLEKKSVGNIPNKYLVAGVAFAGLAWYAKSQRWF